MKLTEAHQFAELTRRCDAALLCETAAEQIEVMGEYLNADRDALPEPLLVQFDAMIDDLAVKTFRG